MMTPEETIEAFLQVWENKPDLFLSPDVTNEELDSLNKQITSSSDTSNAEIAKQIREWCKNHPTIRDAVRAAPKKVKGYQNISTQESHSLQNQYPKISSSLRERLPKITESKPNE
ncbi:hypothetical protein [Oscillatoria sp. HE19RPO]|uniref:hypothetical protein n=1 Tax=Oscillatoria sp. HE19RPO TaxID=2954806 RepID=UPI0020C25135|nr:hypothetical protein [Oscillatoria sp. HE19RPO]